MRIPSFPQIAEPETGVGASDHNVPPLANFKRSIVVATGGLWIANYAILTLRAWLADADPFWTLAGLRALLVLAGCGFCWMLHAALYPMIRQSFWRQFRMVAMLVPLAAGGLQIVNELMFLAASIEPAAPVTADLILMNIGFSLWFFLSWSTMYLVVSYNARLTIEQSRWADVRDHALRAQLQALRNQVNPHFLFNTLNSISALILDERYGDADAMLGKLSSFFRNSLAFDETQFIRLREELALQHAYLEIEQTRYPNLEVVEQIDPATLDKLVPPLILQPLVENAVKFGVSGPKGRSRIIIESLPVPAGFAVRIVDMGGVAPGNEGTGTGLANVRERLAAAFGASASLKAGPHPDGGFTAELIFPG